MTDVMDTVLSEGLNAPIDSEKCRVFRSTHENCVGCEHYKDCEERVKRFFEYVLFIQSQAGLISHEFAEQCKDKLIEGEKK